MGQNPRPVPAATFAAVATDPFDRVDPTPDEAFYAYERKVVHIEVGAIEALREAYADLIPPGGRVLDLMSSWRSHLPYTGLGEVVGLGMNATEMTDNPQLDSFVVHNLNSDPVLPFPDSTFDAVVCAVSVQYLTRPVEVFTEVRRVLVAGAPFVVSFSNRCFPTKAVAIWLANGDAAHRTIVREYFEEAGFVEVVDERRPSPDDPLYVVRGAA
jgi:SAM-dependent methyltransferase